MCCLVYKSEWKSYFCGHVCRRKTWNVYCHLYTFNQCSCVCVFSHREPCIIYGPPLLAQEIAHTNFIACTNCTVQVRGIKAQLLYASMTLYNCTLYLSLSGCSSPHSRICCCLIFWVNIGDVFECSCSSVAEWCTSVECKFAFTWGQKKVLFFVGTLSLSLWSLGKEVGEVGWEKEWDTLWRHLMMLLFANEQIVVHVFGKCVCRHLAVLKIRTKEDVLQCTSSQSLHSLLFFPVSAILFELHKLLPTTSYIQNGTHF